MHLERRSDCLNIDVSVGLLSLSLTHVHKERFLVSFKVQVFYHLLIFSFQNLLSVSNKSSEVDSCVGEGVMDYKDLLPNYAPISQFGGRYSSKFNRYL